MRQTMSNDTVYMPATFSATGRLPKDKEAVWENEQMQRAEFDRYRQETNAKLGLRGASTCAGSLHISLFFDGTNNNERYDTQNATPARPSNIARLFHATVQDRKSGYFSYYIPGVGTPFPEIGELDFSPLGMAGGNRGEDRINWGLLRIVDALQFASNNKFGLDNSVARAHVGAMATQWPYGLWGKLRRREAMKSLLEPLRARIAKALPKVLAIKLYVYGFSRGAAEARTFITWLSELLESTAGAEHPEQELIGIPLSIEFLGLMDTVASVGVAYAAPFADGHMDWADGTQQLPDEQRFPGWIKHCRHFVAAHEQRLCFPLESIRRPDGNYPSYAQEVIYPGMHSDVGGGYPMGDQGKACGGQGDLLSQIALHDMYAAAYAIGAPFSAPRSAIPDNLLQIKPNREMDATTQEDFDTSPELIARFNAWRTTLAPTAADNSPPSASAEPQPLSQPLEEVLAEQLALITGWRIDRYARGSYAWQPFFKQAPQTSEDQQKAEKQAHAAASAVIAKKRQNVQFSRDGSEQMLDFPGLPSYQPTIDQKQLREAAIEFKHDYEEQPRNHTSLTATVLDGVLRSTIYLLNDDDEAREYAQMKAAGEDHAKVLFKTDWVSKPHQVSSVPVHAAVVALFDDHVHDSRAAFLHGVLDSREMWGDYFRYRTVFFGTHSNKRLTAVVVAGRVNGVALAVPRQYRIALNDWKPAPGADVLPPPGFKVIDVATYKEVPFLPEALASLQPTHDIGPVVARQQQAVLLAEEAQRQQASLAFLESTGSLTPEEVGS